ncbi:MAG TPA: aldo/keto reductase [Plantibacter sp.]|uniref:aldo/keto reductase n=1 Tax=unclassified Plantibacter TaxID=2624265 RepID=UPI002CBF2E36|nr:aldo/keto reductase [Plantibacter sp.]
MSPIEPSQAPEPVDLRPLGNTGLLTSPVTVGTSFLGDPASADGSPAPGAGGLARAMLDGPYALVDTSNAYAGGRSETALGEAIRLGGLPGGHGVVSKADRDPSTGVLDRDRVLRSFEESISRLGVERIPIFHLHDPYSVPFAEAAAPDGAIEGMLELREQGLVDAIGVAAGRLSVMRDYVGTGVFDVLLNHNRFTLVDRSATALFEEARSRGMGVFNAAPFGGGVLAARGGRDGKPATYAYQEGTPELLAWVASAGDLADAHGIPLAAAALAFSTRSPLVDSTVVGMGRAERLTQVEALRTTPIPESFWTDLEALGSPPSTVTD